MKINYLIFITFFINYLSNIYLAGVRNYLWNIKVILPVILLFVLIPTTKKINHISILSKPIIVCLIACYAASALASIVINNDVAELTGLIGLIVTISAAYYLVKHLSDPEHQKQFELILTNIASTIIYSSFLMLIVGINLGRGSGRFTGWTDNPNTLGAMLLAISPVIMLRVLKKSEKGKIFDKITLIILIIDLISTGSRSSILGILISSWIILLMVMPTKRIVISIIPLLIILALFTNEESIYNYLQKTRQFSRQAEKVTDLSGRKEVWGFGIKLFEEQPLIGYGFGFEKMILKEYSSRFTQHSGWYFHNSYLSSLIAVGLLGTIPLLALLALASIKGLYLIHQLSINSEPNRMIIYFLALLYSSLFHGFYETWLFSPGNMNILLFWTSVFFILLMPSSEIYQTTRDRYEIHTCC